MRLHAYVFHNVSGDMFFRYDPKTSCLHHAHTFTVEADDLTRAADLIWILTNVGNGNDLRLNHPLQAVYADQVDHYRQRQNRSLCVGDVIVFYERERAAGALVVATTGFEVLVGFDQTINMRVVTNDQPRSESYYAHEQYRTAFDPDSIRVEL